MIAVYSENVQNLQIQNAALETVEIAGAYNYH
jgi:hypothetical protein